MNNIVEKNKCTGCTACMSICPKNAISMVEDNDGFKYPIIDQDKCINCGLCKKTCPVINTKENDSLNKCYVGYSKDEKSIMDKASSGSIFELIANHILDENGIVIGAAFDSNNKLNHIAIEHREELLPLKGSKYLQSNLGNIFNYIKENVKTQMILFVGTPCQVAGIKSIIKSDNLICIDVVCHGVPTPKLFEKYVKELEKENNDKLINYDFRDKKTGWDNYSNTITFKNKTVSELQKDNKYMQLFLSDIALRESCYECNFKLGNKYSDITLGDFWGVNKYYPEMYNKKGTSCIIINTKKGLDLFNKIDGNIIYKECKSDEIVSGNKSLKVSSCKPKNREKFFMDMNNLSVYELCNKYKKKNTWKKIKNKIKQLIKG